MGNIYSFFDECIENLSRNPYVISENITITISNKTDKKNEDIIQDSIFLDDAEYISW
tara:strand:- start:170 stop:340 length:171 start_codon:yes stop_codon:yes gene_type:complete